jgi:Ca2+-transporting ATPase
MSWHAEPVATVAAALETDLERGLSWEEANARLARSGPNLLRPRRRESWWKELLESLFEPLQLLLIAVAVAYFLFGEFADAITILGVILAVSGIEVVNEIRAKRAVAALSSLSAPSALAVRGGVPVEIATSDVVPGDVVLLRAGDRVPADLRLAESVALRVDESSLTGEAVAVAKGADDVHVETAELGDRTTMAYGSTLVTAGRGRGIVVATGRATKIGRIASLSEEVKEPRTPLQRAMRELSRWLTWAALGFSVLVPVLGVLVAGRPLREMILTGLTLAFATIPEELPILITIVLGIGAYRLAQRHAIVKHLRAAETLGGVSVVATDKTGTLTENRMRVTAVIVGGEQRAPRDAVGTPPGRRIMEVGVLANETQITSSGGSVELVGDPTETALVRAALEAGIDVADLRRCARVVEEFPFDHTRKRMSVVLDDHGECVLALKGAPESVLAICAAVRGPGGVRVLDDGERAALRGMADDLAVRGLRTLALAERRLGSGDGSPRSAESVEARLTLLGLVALEDPPRRGAAHAVCALQAAGVRVIMVTGDHPATAGAIANRVNIDARRVVRGRELDAASEEKVSKLAREVSVFARIAPEHKLRIVRALQAGGDAVAVTGDGVNDAPALREAAIGVAMGKGGTDVAREAADLVLADDDFATVTEAVRTGRVLFANLRKAVRYYLAAKVALVSSSLVAVLLRLPVPFEPVQIIVMELFMDLGASVTFVAEPPEADVMAVPPRSPRARFMDRMMTLGILAGGLSLGAAVLIAYLGAWGRGRAIAEARTAAFVAWMIGHVVLAANMRAEHQPLLPRTVVSNRPFLVWAAAAVALTIAGWSTPVLRDRLHVARVEHSLVLMAIAAAIALPSWWEPLKWLRLRRGRTIAEGPA